MGDQLTRGEGKLTMSGVSFNLGIFQIWSAAISVVLRGGFGQQTFGFITTYIDNLAVAIRKGTL